MTKEEAKSEIEALGAKLEAAGIKHFLAVLDRPNNYVLVQSDTTGEDLSVILDCALPTKQDAIYMGIWIGNVLEKRTKENG